MLVYLVAALAAFLAADPTQAQPISLSGHVDKRGIPGNDEYALEKLQVDRLAIMQFPYQTRGRITVAEVVGRGVPIAEASPRSFQLQAEDAVNVRAFGARGDGKRATTSATIVAGSKVLLVEASIFSDADVGKWIIVPGAGVEPTAGPVLTTPVHNPGAGYTDVPIVSYAGTGAGAYGSAFMALQSASIASAGAGCANGVHTFRVEGGVGAFATVTGTVSEGALTGVLTVASGGSYLSLPLNLTSSLLSGPGCTTSPRAALSFGVGRIAVGFTGAQGYNRATTVNLSGGSPSVSTVLGPPVLARQIAPLTARIVRVHGGAQVTLDAAAATSVSGTSTHLFWASDDQVPIQRAIDSASVLGRSLVYFPSGTYFKAAASPALNPGIGSISFKGDGMEASVLAWDAGPTTDNAGTGALFLNTVGGSGANLRFDDLQIRGMLDEGRINVGGPAFYLNRYNSIDFHRVKFFQIPNFAMQNEAARFFRVTDSLFDTVMRDQARCRSCSNVLIANNYFIHSDDDSVALHQGYPSGPGDYRRSIIVSGNIFEDTNGIAILGGREVTVTNNICRRTKFGCVRITANAGESHTPAYAVTVNNNQAFDTLFRPPFNAPAPVAFQVTVQTPRAGKGGAGLIPGVNDASTNTVSVPWGAFDNDVLDPTVPVPAGYGVVIANNRTMRTLPATTAYSNWGYGLPLTSLGFLDMPVSEAVMRPTSGIDTSANIISLKVLNNDIFNVRRGVTINDDPVSPALARHTIQGNTIYDSWEYGILYSGRTTALSPTVNIRDNEIVLDPFRISPGRGAFGSWAENYRYSVGIYAPSLIGVILSGNTFEELFQPTSGLLRPLSHDNIVRGQLFSGLGWNSANYGIGTVAPSGGGFNVVQTNSATNTPTASYTANISGKIMEAAAMPTQGYWERGDFVRNTDPASTAVFGWSRLTVGTANVYGRDWKAVPLR